MFFKGDYLRILTPVTEDGNRPRMQDDRQVYKETFLPLSAKKMIEDENRILPAHLKKKIQIVSNAPKVPVPQPVPPKEVVAEPEQKEINVNDL